MQYLICVFLRLLTSYRKYLQMVFINTYRTEAHRGSQPFFTNKYGFVMLCQGLSLDIFRVYHSIFPSKNEHSSKSLWHSIHSWFAGIPLLDPNPSGSSGLINPQDSDIVGR